MLDKFRWKVMMICLISGFGGIVIGYSDTPYWLTFIIGAVCYLVALRIMESEVKGE